MRCALLACDWAQNTYQGCCREYNAPQSSCSDPDEADRCGHSGVRDMSCNDICQVVIPVIAADRVRSEGQGGETSQQQAAI